MKRFLKTVKSLVFPPRCGGCHALLPTAIGKDGPLFCESCAKEWERELALQCPRCFAAYPECTCQPSVLERAGSRALVKLAPYDDEGRARVVRTLVLDMKKAPRRRVSEFLAKELEIGLFAVLEKENCAVADAVVTHIPRAASARRRTGTDQSEALARAISARTGIAYLPLLRRIKRANAQKKLSAKARMTNLADAFIVRELPVDKLVILVDDVVTTGATASVAASLLCAAGTKRLMTLCVAKTEKKTGRM